MSSSLCTAVHFTANSVVTLGRLQTDMCYLHLFQFTCQWWASPGGSNVMYSHQSHQFHALTNQYVQQLGQGPTTASYLPTAFVGRHNQVGGTMIGKQSLNLCGGGIEAYPHAPSLFITINNSPEETKTSNEFIHWTRIVCVATVWYNVSFIELHPKNPKHTLSHPVAMTYHFVVMIMASVVYSSQLINLAKHHWAWVCLHWVPNTAILHRFKRELFQSSVWLIYMFQKFFGQNWICMAQRQKLEHSITAQIRFSKIN